MKTLTPKQLHSQLQAVTHGMNQALDWIAATRSQAPRLDLEADRLINGLYRHRYQASQLAQSALKAGAVGLFGESEQGKAWLIARLAGNEQGRLETTLNGKTLDYLTHINPGNQATTLVTRFSHQAEVKNSEWPIELALLNEAELAMLLANTFLYDFQPAEREADEAAISHHLQKLQLLRQSEPVAGMSSDDVVALWAYLLRHDGRYQQALESHFWPQAVMLAPYLSIDDRARLFSLLWDEQPELTQAYRRFAWLLQRLSGAPAVLAQLSVLVDDFLLPADGILTVFALDQLDAESDQIIEVRPLINGRVAKAVTVSQAELAFLALELIIPLTTPAREAMFNDVALLDFPGFISRQHVASATDIPLVQLLQRAKVAWLPERYTDRQEMHHLLVCSAASQRADVKAVGRTLDYWVKQTQGESKALRNRRKPGLIWTITPFDKRLTQQVNFDAAVQRYVGEPGDSWGSMLVADSNGMQRMATWLGHEVRREVKLTRISELLQALRRELTENLFNNWLHTTGENSATRKAIADTLLKALQSRTGVHGELLERLLPSREALRSLWQNQHVASIQHTDSEADPFGIGLSLDLLGTPDVPQTGQSDNTHYASRVLRYWVNHLRCLPENAALLEILGIDKPVMETLVDELITAAFRLQIDKQLIRVTQTDLPSTLGQEHQIDQQVSCVLTVLGDFVAWLGFLQLPLATRPDSRINQGHKIFAQPALPAVKWGGTQRLKSLADKPTNTTAFYIYDWLVGLAEMVMLNTDYSAANELTSAQHEQLAIVVNTIRSTTS